MEDRTKLLESLSLCIKRGPYIKYKNFPETVEKVIKILKMGQKGDVAIICQKTGFKERTVYNWLKKIKENSNYNPISKQTRPKAQIFTEEQEDEIALYILQSKIMKGKCFTDVDCLEVLVEFYINYHGDDEDLDYEFQVSKGYIYYFKKRHGFVSKLCHIKRRPSMNIVYMNQFIEDMKVLFDAVQLNRIINIDETALFVAPKNLKIWHSRGQDDVTIPVKFGEKQRITAVCAIAADGTQHKIQFIAKGTTPVVLDSQLGDCHPHLRTFSEKGWTDNSTFYDYLNHLRSQFEDGEIHIILDVFSAHRSVETKKAAEELGIHLHFIPAGYTDLFQPLDARIFAILKSYIRHMIRNYLREDKIITKKDACNFFIRAWEKLTPAEIQESFNFLTIEERWETVNYFDLPIMHTLQYNRSTRPEKRKLIYQEISKNSPKDIENNSIMDKIMESFGKHDVSTIDQISNYVKKNTFFENDDDCIKETNKALSTLASYKILTKVDYRLIPTFKKQF